MDSDPNMRRYGKAFDPRSAHEVLRERTAARLEKQEQAEMEKHAAKPKKTEQWSPEHNGCLYQKYGP